MELSTPPSIPPHLHTINNPSAGLCPHNRDLAATFSDKISHASHEYKQSTPSRET
ncbi:MAG TPA: hypothetical protein VGG81_00925 [Edaphobacter sp.]